MSKVYIKAQTPLPAYFPYPKFLLQMSLSHTARLTYVLLLDRMTLSQKNSWVDAQGRAYVLYPLAGLAEDLQSSISSVTRALRELEAARLKEIYYVAYQKLYAKEGNMTPGVDGKTIDDMSIFRIEQLIELLKSEQYGCAKLHT